MEYGSRQLSCKACLYSTSQLLEFLIHVRTVHYERHASKSDISSVVQSEEDVSTNANNNSENQGFTQSYDDNSSQDLCDSIDTFVAQPLIDTTGINIKQEIVDYQKKPFVEETSTENSNDHGRFSVKTSQNGAGIKMKIEAANLSESNNLDEGKAPNTVPRGNKINDIANNLKGTNVSESTLCHRSDTNFQSFSEPDSIFDCSAQTSFNQALPSISKFGGRKSTTNPSTSQEQTGNFLQRLNSHSTSIGPMSGIHNNKYNGAVFQPFSGRKNEQVFPNASLSQKLSGEEFMSHYTDSFSSHDSSHGTSLYNSSGGFLPSFHALMCAGFVTMPQSQILKTIKCDQARWDYIQQTLHNAFRKFPYLTAPEVQILSSLTDLTCQQVKTLFVVARLQHGISWDHEEIQNARNYLRIPMNRFSGQ